MTHTNKKIRFACGVGITILGVGMALIACGGDDSSVGEGSPDAGTDGTTLGSNDGAADASSDAGDSSKLDSSPGQGDGGDGSPGDGATDGSSDGSSDGGPAAVAAELTSFANKLYQGSCTNLAAACAGFDAGAGVNTTVDIPTCEAGEKQGGFLEGSTQGIYAPGALSRGTVTFNAAAAANCTMLSDQLNFAAPITSAQYLAAASACFSATTGTVPAGGTCYASLECVPHTYCNVGAYDAGAPDAGDGGDAGDAAAPPTGLCQPVLAAGQSCAANQSGDSCSTRASQLDNSYCDLADFGGTNDCTGALLAEGQICPYDLACTSGICGPSSDPNDFNYYCLSQVDFRSVLCGAYPAPTP